MACGSSTVWSEAALSTKAKSAIVIGGGISGLATAALLAKSGMKVTLFEGLDQLGGRARQWQQDGFKFDMGPSWYLMPEAFEQFFKLMGTSAERELALHRLSPAYQCFFENEQEPVVISEKLHNVLETFESLETGAGERLQRYLDSAEDTYALAMRHFLYTNFETTKSFTNKEVLSRAGKFLGHLLRPLASYSGKYFKNDKLRKILNFPAVFLGASPYRTPSMYHLMTHVDFNVGVFYPMGGMFTIIEAIERLAKSHGVEIRLGSPVSKILHADGRAIGVQVGDEDHLADVVVASADLHHVETSLLDEQVSALPKRWWQKREPGPSALLLYLGVRGKIPQLTHHTLLNTSDWKGNFDQVFKRADGESKYPNPASLYICAPSVTDPTVAPEGYENLFVLVPIAPDPALGNGGIAGTGNPAVEAAADQVIEQISKWVGIPDLADRIVVRRTMSANDFVQDLNAWSGTALGMAHTLRQSAFFRPANKSKKLKNLLYVGHNTIPGIGLPMCLIGAELVVKHLTGDKSAGPTSSELRPLPAAAWVGIR